MSFLLDTNILSELRKERKADAKVLQWARENRKKAFFLGVISLGEIRRGIEAVRPKDPRQAAALEGWRKQLKQQFQNRILPVSEAIAERWGLLDPRQPLPATDALIAATALEYELVVVTRNVADFERSGVSIVNPFL